ncbi:glutamate synthase domain-containing protein 2 [Desulfitispora alkaliphila]
MEVLDLQEGEDKVLKTRLPGVNSVNDFKNTVKKLKEETGVPVGVKIAASHFLERELELFAEAEVDFIAVDGAEAGTHGASPTAEDDLGLPAIYAIARAGTYLKSNGLDNKISLIAGGGLVTPGQFLKAMALGADAVYIGTAAIMAMVAQQVTKVAPQEPPPQLILQTGRAKDKFDIDTGVKSLVNYLSVSRNEMVSIMYALGKDSLKKLDQEDLCCSDPFLAKALNLPYAGVSPEKQESYFKDTIAELHH